MENRLYVFNFHDNKWKKISTSDITGRPPAARFGHTAVLRAAANPKKDPSR
jgi:hypothetical protein